MMLDQRILATFDLRLVPERWEVKIALPTNEGLVSALRHHGDKRALPPDDLSAAHSWMMTCGCSTPIRSFMYRLSRHMDVKGREEVVAIQVECSSPSNRSERGP